MVDDDPEICELLADYLGRHGYRVFTADGAEALHTLRAEHTPDLLIVDLMLPGDDGFTICRDVRKHSDVPIIMLTASADETDRILGLELGADDYLGKPFNPRELLARIKAVLRRTRCAPPELPAGQARWVSFGNWQLDRMTRELIDLQGTCGTFRSGFSATAGVFSASGQGALPRRSLCADPWEGCAAVRPLH